MSDNLHLTGAQDRAKINIHEDHEVRYWTEALGLTKEQLIAAVQSAGTSAAAVRQHLTK